MTNFAAIFNNNFYVKVEARNIKEAFNHLENYGFSTFNEIMTLSGLYEDWNGSVEMDNYAIISYKKHDFVYGAVDSNGYTHLNFTDTEYVNTYLNPDNLEIAALIEKFDTMGYCFIREFENNVYIDNNR